MISKQDEVFKALEKSLGSLAKQYHHLLENFFHALFPLEKRSFLDPEVLKNFFLLLLEKIQSSKQYLSKEVGGYQFLIANDRAIEKIMKVAQPMIQLDLDYDERSFYGMISRI